MKTALRQLCLLPLIALLAVPLHAATHDLQITMTTSATQGRIPVGPVTIRVTIRNNGPQKVAYEERLKISVNKFDHTGQQFLKTVGSRDLPLLDPPGGDLNSFVLDFTDTSTAGTFFYKAALGPGYYTDSNNTNHRPESAVIFFNPVAAPVRWTSRLTEQDFTRAGATLTAQQISKLSANTYTLQSIATSGTDRLVDQMRCNSCHNGTGSQAAARYAPVTPIERTTNHKLNRTDTNATARYSWAEAGTDGVIAHFIASTNGSKPLPLEKIFRQWLLDGAQQ